MLEKCKNKRVLVLPPIDMSEGRGGGPGAVIRIMHKADKGLCFDFPKRGKRIPKNPADRGYKFFRIKKWLIKFAPVNLLFLWLRAERFIRSNRVLIQKYDCILVHTLLFALRLIRHFPEKKVVFVYHGQGAASYQYSNHYRGGFLIKKILDRIEQFVYNNVELYGFPSRGGRDALLATNKHLVALPNEDSRLLILNNGIDTERIDQEQAPSELVAHLDIADRLIFCTVAGLSKAKGVDRVPLFLGGLKRAGVPFVWILVGDGKERSKVCDAIQHNNIQEETKWFPKKFPREAIMTLLRESDFYILFHRQSIFDLTILEAIYCHCVPVLSKTGGNLEFNRNDNILFVDSPYELHNLDKYSEIFLNHNKEHLNALKLRNKKVVQEHFSLDSFIRRYRAVFNPEPSKP